MALRRAEETKAPHNRDLDDGSIALDRMIPAS